MASLTCLAPWQGQSQDLSIRSLLRVVGLLTFQLSVLRVSIPRHRMSKLPVFSGLSLEVGTVSLPGQSRLRAYSGSNEKDIDLTS